MPLFRKRETVRSQPAPSAGPAVPGPPHTESPLFNVFGRELAPVLDEDDRIQTFGVLRDTTRIAAPGDTARAFAALDWLVRVWVPGWTALLPDVGEELSGMLVDLPPVTDLGVAEAAGLRIGVLASMPAEGERTIATYCESFYEKAAASAARAAAAKACPESGGTAVAAAASSTILDACMAARTDVALAGVTAIAMMFSLDGVVPYIQDWASGPGSFEAKKMSISNLAPLVARRTLEPTVAPLRRSAVELYLRLAEPQVS